MKKSRNIRYTSGLELNNSYEGEPLTIKLERIIKTGVGVEKTQPIIYNEQLTTAHDIRADKWDVAITAIDKVQKGIAENKMKAAAAAAAEIKEKETGDE